MQSCRGRDGYPSPRHAAGRRAHLSCACSLAAPAPVRRKWPREAQLPGRCRPEPVQTACCQTSHLRPLARRLCPSHCRPAGVIVSPPHTFVCMHARSASACAASQSCCTWLGISGRTSLLLTAIISGSPPSEQANTLHTFLKDASSAYAVCPLPHPQIHTSASIHMHTVAVSIQAFVSSARSGQLGPHSAWESYSISVTRPLHHWVATTRHMLRQSTRATRG